MNEKETMDKIRGLLKECLAVDTEGCRTFDEVIEAHSRMGFKLLEAKKLTENSYIVSRDIAELSAKVCKKVTDVIKRNERFRQAEIARIKAEVKPMDRTALYNKIKELAGKADRAGLNKPSEALLYQIAYEAYFKEKIPTREEEIAPQLRKVFRDFSCDQIEERLKLEKEELEFIRKNVRSMPEVPKTSRPGAFRGTFLGAVAQGVIAEPESHLREFEREDRIADMKLKNTQIQALQRMLREREGGAAKRTITRKRAHRGR